MLLRVEYKCNANLKELLVPSNPDKNEIKEDGLSCLKSEAKRWDSCRNFSVTENSLHSFANKSLTCANVAYLAQCVDCSLRGVGSSVNF